MNITLPWQKNKMPESPTQKSCCSDQAESQIFKPFVCPTNGKKGQSVNVKTLHHLIKPERRSEIKTTGYFFCKTHDCDTVYYHPASGQCFDKSDLTVRIGLKETEDPVWVCYCFDLSKKMIAEEMKRRGQSISGNRIREEVAADNCECEIKNPSGRCCLGEVLAAEKEAQANLRTL